MYKEVFQKFKEKEMLAKVQHPGAPTTKNSEYGRPIAGSMTERRGKKAGIHISKEVFQLCQIIDESGFPNEYNPELKVILFRDLFNIYTYISNKVVGILLRARKHEFLYFEGEMLYQRRDDEVPILMLKSMAEISEIEKESLEQANKELSQQGSALPTTVLMDRMRN